MTVKTWVVEAKARIRVGLIANRTSPTPRVPTSLSEVWLRPPRDNAAAGAGAAGGAGAGVHPESDHRAGAISNAAQCC